MDPSQNNSRHLTWEELASLLHDYEQRQLVRLTPDEKQLYERLPIQATNVPQEIVNAMAEFTDSEESARLALGTPLLHFHGRTPAEVTNESDDGTRKVIEFFSAVRYGHFL